MLSSVYTRVATGLVDVRAGVGRGLAVGLLAAALAVGVAITAVAADSGGELSQFEPGVRALSVPDSDRLPLAHGNGADRLMESFRDARARQEARKDRLASPAAVSEREESATKFAGIPDTAALALVAEAFDDALEGSAVPDFDDVADGRRVKKFIDDSTVVFAGEDERPPVLVKLPRPARAPTGDGRKRLVDLSLERRADGDFSPANAVADLSLPSSLADGLVVGGTRILLEGSAVGELLDREGGHVAYPNALVDVDILAAPVTNGVELFWQLRSGRAPEELAFDVELPHGAVAKADASGGAAVVDRDGDLLATLSAPQVIDAQGQDVEADLTVNGDAIVVSVAHRGEDLAYPLLVDPVWEDWHGNGYQTWFHQYNPALSELGHWSHMYHGVAAGTYAARYSCYAPVSCYKWNVNLYDSTRNDGLHVYVRPSTFYPAGSYGQWLYQPPGNSTRIVRADMGIKFMRMRSPTAYPYMFTGIWSIAANSWITDQTFASDFNNHWNAHFAGGSVGPQTLVFGFYTPANVQLGAWRDGYMGSAIIEMSDPEAPTITNIGATREDGGDISQWTSESARYNLSPTATDPGLGVDYFALSGPGVITEDNANEKLHPCLGDKSDPCPPSWTAPSPLQIDTATVPEGVNTTTVRAEDVLGHATTSAFQVKVDREAPGLELSGPLWEARELPPEPSGGYPVLAAGQHRLTIDATDPAEGPAPAGTRSGVVKIEVKVEDEVVATDEGTCAAGNCSRSYDWDFDTSSYGGKRKVRVIATDGAGNVSKRSFRVRAPARGEMVLPVDGNSTSSRLGLQAAAHEPGFSAVEFQYREMPLGSWKTIGGVGTMLRDDEGNVISATSHPLDQPGQRTKKLIWDAAEALELAMLSPKPGPFLVRAVFAGNGGYASKAVNVELDEKGLSSGNAHESVGPGSVDLLTGNFSYTATDASLAGFGQGLTLTRTFNSQDPMINQLGPFGFGWVASAPVEGVSDYSSLWELSQPGIDGWVDVYDSAGMRIRFEEVADGEFEPETGFEGLELDSAGPDYTLTDLDGTVTTFTKLEEAAEFMPSKVQEAGEQGASEFVYQLSEGLPPRTQLKRIIAPGPPGINCRVADVGQLARGCKVLELNYDRINLGSLGAPYRVMSIQHVAWDPVASAMKVETVAEFSYYDAPCGCGSMGRLREAWDPRISPALKETYTYGSGGHLATVTSPDEAPWEMAYVPDDDPYAGQLESVSRTSQASGLESWRMSWDVELSGSEAPYQADAAMLDQWGQTDRPTDATAILPPDQEGDGFDRATVYYVNQDGRVVNTVEPGPRVTTTEHDRYGNVVRELTPENFQKAVTSGAGSATLAGLLSTYRTYSADGLELTDELGPQREVTLESGQVTEARAHTVTSYDEGYSGDDPPHLPTTVTVGAQVDPSSPDEDMRVTKTDYDWTLRLPTATIADVGGLDVTRSTAYDGEGAGLEVESRMPKSDGQDAGTRETVYYTHDGSSPDPDCRNRPEWFNLACKTMPAAQPTAGGLPDLPATTYTYDRFGQVATTSEQVGAATRTTTTAYDAAGRKQSEALAVDGDAVGAPQGLVAAYGFDEGVGATVSDSSGTGNDGTVSGADWEAEGRFGGALDFDGVDDAVVVADDDSLDMSNALTLSAWIKPDDLTQSWRHIFSKQDGTEAVYGLAADAPFGGPALGVYGTSGLHLAAASTSLVEDEWAHLAATWNGESGRVYLDGVLIESQAIDDTAITSTGDLRIGGAAMFGFESFFDGLIDEARVYDRALSAGEVQADRDLAVSAQTAGLGAPVEAATFGYSATTGRPTTVTAGGEAVTTAYDDVGRPVSYTDADGNVSTTAYDNLNRPVSVDDGKASQTFGYDAQTGLLSSLTDSHAGTFTAAYDKDGQIESKTYPNGLTADYTYDAAAAPVALKYTKTTDCSSDCVWIDESVSESVHGQWRTHDWNLSSQGYGYDGVGRLVEVEDDVHAPAAVEGCTIRSYSFDANSNRTSLLTRPPDAGGACQPGAAGVEGSYSYDSADRLTGSGVAYDTFGRMSQVGSGRSGGGVLTYRYFANDMVRTISQDGVSKTYALDPAGRHRQTVATGGTTHTEVLHYADDSDSPAWSEVIDGQGQQVSWERTITGIDGDLAATHASDSQGSETVLQLSNLHGDTVATASLDPQATAPTDMFETDEFGNPRQPSGADKRYGWLGAKQRRTELASGVIQMGVRSYVPAMGRFTSVDPVVGGSANDYDYANQDPVNTVDLDGRCAGPLGFLAPLCGQAVRSGAAWLLKKIGPSAFKRNKKRVLRRGSAAGIVKITPREITGASRHGLKRFRARGKQHGFRWGDLRNAVHRPDQVAVRTKSYHGWGKTFRFTRSNMSVVLTRTGRLHSVYIRGKKWHRPD